jgi:mannose-6-phosphate isomerase-like protein (cupin superfamily)
MLRSVAAAFLLLMLPIAIIAQAPAAVPARRPAPAAQAASPRPLNLTFQVTDALGTPLADVKVTTQAPVGREGVTGPDGSLRFANVRPGTYRFRFAREGSITLERDITVRPGEPLAIDVSLNAAPAAPKMPEPPKPAVPEPGATKALPPGGEPKVVPIPLFLEKNFIGREGRKESPLGCTPTGTATLLQLREAWLNHTHDDADEWLYLVAGEGTLRIGTTEQRITAGTFSSIPHSVGHALLPTGRNPLIIISVLSGPPCAAK